MIINDLKRLAVFVSCGIVEDTKEDQSTRDYIGSCYKRFLSGDFGTICAEDKAANIADIIAGDGHALAAYPAFGTLQSKIYIEATFYAEASLDDIDYNNITICYPYER